MGEVVHVEFVPPRLMRERIARLPPLPPLPPRIPRLLRRASVLEQLICLGWALLLLLIVALSWSPILLGVWLFRRLHH